MDIVSSCQGWGGRRCCAERPWCATSCPCTGEPSTCPHIVLRQDTALVRKARLQDARREARDMTDRDLGLYLAWLRRVAVNAEDDSVPDWMQAGDTIRQGAAEAEWDWRRAAERRGGPSVERDNFRERLERLRERHDLPTVVALFTRLRKSGSELVGLCPRHTEKTPSFYVNAEKQVFLCRGCGWGGDVFTLVEDLQTGSFIEAVTFLEAHRVPDWARATGE